jgi:hypothetical protein
MRKTAKLCQEEKQINSKENISDETLVPKVDKEVR